MNLQNYYYCFEQAIPERICDVIIEYGESQKKQIATISGSTPEEMEENNHIRKSDVVWIDETWLYNLLAPFVKRANQDAGWNFSIEEIENCQWTKYSETQHYDWHRDSAETPYNLPKHRLHGLIRKISLTLSLEHGDKYEGGNLQFRIDEKEITLNNSRKKGTIVIFPSFVKHRVSPVTNGTRYSLVAWNCGKPFI